MLSPGDYVRCAVTGDMILLPDLRYWSVELQEPYLNAQVATSRYLQRRARKKV